MREGQEKKDGGREGEKQEKRRSRESRKLQREFTGKALEMVVVWDALFAIEKVKVWRAILFGQPRSKERKRCWKLSVRGLKSRSLNFKISERM